MFVTTLNASLPESTSNLPFLSRLSKIANQEPLPKNSTVQQQDQPWRLKARSWLSVRPYTYPTYSEPERVAVMRSARVWFKNMKVQESDPVWEHVRYRAAVSAPAASLKERKQGKRDGDLKMKSEVGMSSSSSTYASALHARSGAGNSPPEPGQIKASLKVPDGDGEREEGELSASSTPPPRAVPGASASVPVGRIPPGSKLPLQHKQHVFLPSRPMTPPMVGHSNVAPTGASSLPGSTTGVKRSNGPVDVRAIRRPPPPEQSERARPAPPIPPPLPPSDKKTAVRRDALSTPPSQQKGTVSKDKDSNRDRQRAKEESKLERERDRAKRERERDAKQQEREVAKEKEKERGKAALAQQARRLAASTPPIPAASSTSSSLVSKKRVRGRGITESFGSRRRLVRFRLDCLAHGEKEEEGKIARVRRWSSGKWVKRMPRLRALNWIERTKGSVMHRALLASRHQHLVR